MEAAKKRRRKNILFAVLAVLLIAVLTAIPFFLDARQKSAENKASILSAQVGTGTIRKTLSGTGTLTEQDAEEVSVPQGVEVTEYLVKNGQAVRQGDPVAIVNRASVMETITTVQKAMAEVETELETLRTGSDYTYLSAPASGRVKAIYAKVGDAAHDVILQHGALAILSLDGLMAVQFPAGNAVSIGAAVTVQLADGTEIAGRVESVIDGEATVTFSDEHGEIGETVTVRDSGGTALDSGSAFVHSAWKAMATGGTVSDIYVQEDRPVSVYGIMIVLSGTATGGNYEELIAEHRSYEEIMEKLFRMAGDGCLTAPSDGIVSGVDEDILKDLSSEKAGQPTLTLNFLVHREGAASLMLLSSEGETSGTDSSGNEGGSSGEGSSGGESGSGSEGGSGGEGGSSGESGSGDEGGSGGLTETKRTGAVIAKSEIDITVEWADDKSKETILLRAGYYVADVNGVQSTLKENCYYIITTDENGEAFNFIAIDLPYQNEEPDNPSGPGQNGPGGFSGNPGGNGMGGMSGGSGASGAPSVGSGTTTTTTAKETRYPTDGTTILSVIPQETVSVSITVDELDILSVHAGQEAMVTLDALKGQSFSGIITEVNTIASNEGGNSKYSAVVELKRTDRMLGGMNASASITVEERENVLLIPSEALAEQDAESIVYTAYDAKTETLSSPVRVKTGLSDGNQVQILSGLQEGDTVWYSYYDTLEIEGLPGDFPRL